MLNRFDQLVRQAQRLRVAAPSKSTRYENPFKPADSQTGTKKKRKVPNSSCIDDLILCFIDNIRKHIDFNAPLLKPSDPDYDVFKDDPKMPLVQYVTMIVKKCDLVWSCIPAAMVLLRRMFMIKEGLMLTVNNMHRLVAVSLLMADKFIEDNPISNNEFGNISIFPTVRLFSNTRTKSMK